MYCTVKYKCTFFTLWSFNEIGLNKKQMLSAITEIFPCINQNFYFLILEDIIEQEEPISSEARLGGSVS